jgi:hypothetical protein
MKPRTLLLWGAGCGFVSMLGISRPSAAARGQGKEAQKTSCSDPWGSCKPKIEVVGRDGDCVTFACEVGTKAQHLIKTNDEEGKKALIALIERDKSKR